MAEVTRLADDAWQPVAEPAGTGSGAAGPDKPQLECAELAYVSSGYRRSGPHHVIRYVVIRRDAGESRTPAGRRGARKCRPDSAGTPRCALSGGSNSVNTDPASPNAPAQAEIWLRKNQLADRG